MMALNTARTRQDQKPLKVRNARIYSTAALLALALTIPGYMIFGNAGMYIMFAVALAAYCGLPGTGLYRIASGDVRDEFETAALRRSAVVSYTVLSVAVLVGLFAMSLASDKGFSPGYPFWSFLLWFALGTLSVLPAVVVSWQLRPEVDDS